MARDEHDTGLMRLRGERESAVTPIELFFDLVYVFAITQLSHHLLDHLSIGGALQTLLLLVVVWRAWIDFAWLTNWFNPNHRVVRLVLVAMMLVGLLMSTALPDAFGDRGLFFAAMLVALQVGRHFFTIAALRGNPNLRRNFQRIGAWSATSAVFWLSGGIADDWTRVVLWVVAASLDFFGAAVGFWTPGLGSSHTSDWVIAGAHMAERCRLFIILALGESILVIGATFGELPILTETVAAFVVAFLGSVALWWIYFDRTSEAAEEVIAHSPDPGRLGRSAYTYYHLPMVAGIIVAAVGDELVISHPMDHADMATTAVVLGGPALFLAGHALFKLAVFNRVSIPRVTAILALAALVPVSLIVPPLVLSAVATVIVAAVAVWDTWLIRHSDHLATTQPQPTAVANEERA